MHNLNPTIPDTLDGATQNAGDAATAQNVPVAHPRYPGYPAFPVNSASADLCHARTAWGERILAQGEMVPNDTWLTKLNNNDLVVGPTGAGKTRYYVKPNLLQMNESLIVTDAKGLLYKEVGPLLQRNGYRVLHIDFTNLANSFGYNPFDFVNVDASTGKLCEQDIVRIATTLCPVENADDAFWDYAARNFLSILCAFVFEALRPEERNLGSVTTLLSYCSANDSNTNGATEQALDEFAERRPSSYSARKWGAFRATTSANKMYGSILGIVSEKLDPFIFDTALGMYSAVERVNFKALGRCKTALFLTVSDTDRSLDRLVTLLYIQALQELCNYADDECAGGTLPVPVRLYLDDFATNCVIPDFDNIISTIRSRNISVSVVLQSITQLDKLYGNSSAMTIVNGCDHWLYLGGQDIATANVIATKANKPIEQIINMPLDEAWLFERGTQGKKVRCFDLKSHPCYPQLLESKEATAGKGAQAV